MAILIGKNLKRILSINSIKKEYIKQNQDLFGKEIYLECLKAVSSQKKVKISESWYNVLENIFEGKSWLNLSNTIRKLYKKKTIYPSPNNIFNAYDLTPFDDVRVVIIGQDPYHGESQAHGLSFSVENNNIPPSLKNIFKELEQDLGINNFNSGNLTSWAEQGVLLINSVLTVEKNKANSHQGLGWEDFTQSVISKLSENKKDIVYLLWGKHAQSYKEFIDCDNNLVLTAPHPSPLSAHNGFFGCKHFSKTNDFLQKNGKKPIIWKL